MKLSRAREIVKEQFFKHGLHRTGWSFEFNNAKSQLGHCHSGFKVIVLSKPITKINDEARVTNTILHEIAHALVGCNHGHDITWQMKAVEIGCTGERIATKHKNLSLALVKRPYTGTCPICKKVVAERFRLSTSLKYAHHVPCMNSTGGREQIIWKKHKT